MWLKCNNVSLMLLTDVVVNDHDVNLDECTLFSQPGMRVENIGSFVRVYFDMGLTLLWNRGTVPF